MALSSHSLWSWCSGRLSSGLGARWFLFWGPNLLQGDSTGGKRDWTGPSTVSLRPREGSIPVHPLHESTALWLLSHTSSVTQYLDPMHLS